MFHSQCYLVATVIHTQYLSSQICVYLSLQYRGGGWAKEIKKKGQQWMPRVKGTFPHAIRSPALYYTDLPSSTDSLTVKTIISVSLIWPWNSSQLGHLKIKRIAKSWYADISVKFLLCFRERLSTLNNLVARSVAKPCARVIFRDLGLIWCAYVRQEETYQTLMIDVPWTRSEPRICRIQIMSATDTTEIFSAFNLARKGPYYVKWVASRSTALAKNQA
jgi:hypothetical protein